MSMIQKWFEELRNIWLAKDINKVPSLLSSSFKYYEDPFEPPLTSPQEVVHAWQEVKDQDIKKLDIDVVMEAIDEGLATYDFVYKNSQGETKHSKGAYYLKLDIEGKAVEFRQWWVSK